MALNPVAKQLTWSDWKRPLIAVALTFLCSVENGMLAMGEWPYMSTLDPETTSSFYGYSIAVSKTGHVVSAFVFALWAQKIGGIKIPLLAGRGITLIACVMYIMVELIPSGRRLWMAFCYLLFGVGFGTYALLRSYIARVTSEENRSTAYALQNGAVVLTVVIGPIAQLSFAGLPYPGVVIIPPHIKLNVFSAPIWFAVLTNVIAIACTFLLEDVARDEVGVMTVDESSKYSFIAIKDQLTRLRTLNLPWLPITLVLVVKMVSGLFGATLTAVLGPMMTTMFGLSGEQIVLILAICQIIVGALAIVLSLVYLLCKLGSRVSCRVLFVFSNVLVIASYVITFPYPFTSSPMQPFNETTGTGCDSNEYSWCSSQLASVMNIIPFLITLIVITSFAIPTAMMSLDTIYSKMFGTIDQNVFQSIFVIAEDIMTIVGPIYGSAVFTAIGLNFIYIINGFVYIIATLMWLVAWKWLAPYN